jgi:DNA-binding response OmpR family regulator
MQHSHRVVSRAELEHALWGDSPPAGDVLRAHVYALRNAIDKPFERKLLHTVHGEGYRLADLGTES